MKKVLLSMVVLAGLAIGTTSCGKAKEAAKDGIEATKAAADKTAEAAKAAADKTAEAAKAAAEAVKEGADKAVDAVTGDVAEGKKIFTAKGCVACHKEEGKLVGPGVKEIAQVYADKKGNMVKFLKGNAEAIVDPAQFAIMKANLAITQSMKAEDLQALTAYMRSIK